LSIIKTIIWRATCQQLVTGASRGIGERSRLGRPPPPGLRATSATSATSAGYPVHPIQLDALATVAGAPAPASAFDCSILNYFIYIYSFHISAAMKPSHPLSAEEKFFNMSSSFSFTNHFLSISAQ
jgi:hypothetical protein